VGGQGPWCAIHLRLIFRVACPRSERDGALDPAGQTITWEELGRSRCNASGGIAILRPVRTTSMIASTMRTSARPLRRMVPVEYSISQPTASLFKKYKMMRKATDETPR
jgi:hypothetical protein